ncbi:MAG: putative holin [Burkholderiales bacterium]|nr:putative holin [Burkholderiales bacterium]
MQTQATSTTKRPIHQRVPRLSGWTLITIALLLAVWALAPQQLPVSLYKLSLVSLAAVIGYWLDRSIFPYARPDSLMCSSMLDGEPEPVPKWEMGDETVGLALTAERAESLVFGLAMLRRAVIVGCAMLAMGLGA